MKLEWRYAAASVIGTSHLNRGVPCQDASDCQLLGAESERLLVCVAADGAGSAKHADVGARLLCSIFMDEVRKLIRDGGGVTDVTRRFVESSIARFQQETNLLAQADNTRLRDYACTILAAVVGNEDAAFLQIGDGAIVIASREEPDTYGWIFWPDKGEYANQTVFATDEDALSSLCFETRASPADEIALFTDGLERLALHFAEQTAHDPFFRPVFATLRSASANLVSLMSTALQEYLDSPAINSRTDDDKTLVVATRRIGEKVEIKNSDSNFAETSPSG